MHLPKPEIFKRVPEGHLQSEHRLRRSFAGLLSKYLLQQIVMILVVDIYVKNTIID